MFIVLLEVDLMVDATSFYERTRFRKPIRNIR
jgi:hypothetical protein